MSTTELSQAANRTRQLQADFALLLVALVWGSTFVMVKDAVAEVPVFTFLSARLTIAFAILVLLFWRQVTTATYKEWLASTLIGIFLFGGYAFQTFGLQYTTASKTGFITGLYVPFVPVFLAIATRRLPTKRTIFGMTAATTGLALISLTENLTLEWGDTLVLLCAVSYALHIITVGVFAPRMNTTALSVGQLGAAALFFSIAACLWESPTMLLSGNIGANVWGAILFTAAFGTSFAFFAQTTAQKFTSATHTAFIFATEPVFAAFFGILLHGDPLTPRIITGGALIIAGMIIVSYQQSASSE